MVTTRNRTIGGGVKQRCWMVHFIGLAIILQLQFHVVYSRAVLGVDLGSLYMKVALVQSGSPLEIVTNLHSKRKTEQLVLFDNDSRFYGADAAALLARKSHMTPAAMSVMLGRDENHPTVQVRKTETHKETNRIEWARQCRTTPPTQYEFSFPFVFFSFALKCSTICSS
jgi:Hsp70 protein